MVGHGEWKGRLSLVQPVTVLSPAAFCFSGMYVFSIGLPLA
jgi:hypothetical protein